MQHHSTANEKIIPLELNEYEDFKNINNKERLALYMLMKGSVSLSLNKSTYVFVAPCIICLNNFDEVQFLHSHMMLAKSLRFNPSYINRNMTFDILNKDTYWDLVSQYDFFSLRPFLDRAPDSICYLPVDYSILEAIDKYFSKMITELTFKRDGLWSCRSRSLLMRIIMLVEETYDNFTSNSEPVFNNNSPITYISRTLEYIHTNYSNEIKLVDLCKLTSVCRTTLIKNFKLITGFTVNAYILEYRMKVALKSLRFSFLTINEISKDCGFNYDTYFIKQFIKRYGLTPTEFRKQALEKRKRDFKNGHG